MEIIKNDNTYQLYKDSTLVVEFIAQEQITDFNIVNPITHVNQIEFIANTFQELNLPLDKDTQNNLGLIKLEPEAAYILTNYYETKLLEIAGELYWLVISKAEKKQDYKEYSIQLLCLMSVKLHSDFESIELLVNNSKGADKHLVMGWVMGAGNIKALKYFVKKYKLSEEEFFEFLHIAIHKNAYPVFECILNQAPSNEIMDKLLADLPARGKFEQLILVKVARLH